MDATSKRDKKQKLITSENRHRQTNIREESNKMKLETQVNANWSDMLIHKLTKNTEIKEEKDR